MIEYSATKPLLASGIRLQTDRVDQKTQRLQGAYLDEVVSLEEFRSSKSRLVAERQSLKENLARLEDEQSNRLEPVLDFLKSSKQAGLVALTDDHAEKRDWLRKAGSNRRVLSGRLVFEPRGAWKLVATSTLLANNPERLLPVARGHSPELVGVHNEAERAGFVLAIAHSTSPAVILRHKSMRENTLQRPVCHDLSQYRRLRNQADWVLFGNAMDVSTPSAPVRMSTRDRLS